jgi:hypothetical protein
MALKPAVTLKSLISWVFAAASMAIKVPRAGRNLELWNWVVAIVVIVNDNHSYYLPSSIPWTPAT